MTVPRSAVAILLVATMAVAGCDRAVPEPAEAESCGGLVRVGVALVEDYAEALADVPLSVVNGDAEPPAVLAELASRGDELDLAAARLGCDAAELNAAIVERTAGLSSDDPTVQVYLDTVRRGVVGTLPPPPTTTTTGDAGS
ncbi:MAG: hypothetical protein PVI35_03180 [Acidimicrobiia bacterium]